MATRHSFCGELPPTSKLPSSTMAKTCYVTLPDGRKRVGMDTMAVGTTGGRLLFCCSLTVQAMYLGASGRLDEYYPFLYNFLQPRVVPFCHVCRLRSYETVLSTPPWLEW